MVHFHYACNGNLEKKFHLLPTLFHTGLFKRIPRPINRPSKRQSEIVPDKFQQPNSLINRNTSRNARRKFRNSYPCSSFKRNSRRQILVHTLRESVSIYAKRFVECVLRLAIQAAKQHAKFEEVGYEGMGVGFSLYFLDKVGVCDDVETPERHAHGEDWKVVLGSVDASALTFKS